MLKLYSCLTPHERDKTLKILYGLKDQWEPRMGVGFPFYTLGAASYLDAGYEGEIAYRVKAKKTNLLLKKNFQFLYDKVAETLEKSTGHKVVYEEIFALPGFHIWQKGLPPFDPKRKSYAKVSDLLEENWKGYEILSPPSSENMNHYLVNKYGLPKNP